MTARFSATISFKWLAVSGVRRVCLLLRDAQNQVDIGAYRLRHDAWRLVRVRRARYMRDWRTHARSLAAFAYDCGGGMPTGLTMSPRLKHAWDKCHALRAERRARKATACAYAPKGCALHVRRRCVRGSALDRHVFCPRVSAAACGTYLLRTVGIDISPLRARDRMRIARWALRHWWGRRLSRIWRILAHTPVLPRACVFRQKDRARELLFWAFRSRARPAFRRWAIAQAQLAGWELRIDDYGVVLGGWLLVQHEQHSAVLELPPRLSGAAPREAVAWTFQRRPAEYHPEVEQ